MTRAALLALSLLLPAPAQTRAYEVVAAESKFTVFVGRAGLFGGLGHDHTITVRNFSGRVTVPPGGAQQAALEMEIEAGSLLVADPGVDEKERAEIQKAMETEVLEVARFPKIRFKSVSVADVKPAGFVLNGDLTLHGVARRVAVPVAARVTPEEVRAGGEVTIRQTDFGIKPYSAGLGTVKVKNELKLTFAIVARAR